MADSGSKFDRLPKPLASVREFNAAKGILVFLTGALLYFAHSAFVPIALAFLFALSAAVILMLALGAIAGLGAMAWAPAQDWYASAPRTLSVIQKKIKPVAQMMSRIDELSKRAEVVGSGPKNEAGTVVSVTQASAAASLLAAVRDSAIGLATFSIITLFLLAGGPPMVARMTAAFFDHLKANHILRLIERVRAEVGHFYVTTALINLGLGVSTWLLALLWGMPTPYLWGALAAMLNFIPYAGSAATLLILSLVAVVSFDGLGHAVGVSLSYVAVAAIEGQFVQPLLIGRRLEVNPLLIFLGLWFGGLFWGVAGVILATPILVALKVIAENSVDGTSMLQFLGPNVDTPGPNVDTPPHFPKLDKAAAKV
jgi:predicted PurR-regulated permease PerM